MRPLIAEHEIITLPSVSTLAVLRRELTERKPAPKMVAVLADPVFSSDDPRVKAEGQRHELSSLGQETQAAGHQGVFGFGSELERSARDLGINSFERLRFSRREADEIATLTPAGENFKAVDFQANRATAMSAELSQYRIVHFATHGLLDDKRPELSGLVLSLVDERGRAQDGFLHLHEIYNLHLPAELIVLSACQTALGQEIRGEGLVGLTRGFMYAGARRVIASLWRVPDKATAELMKQFYRGILVDKLRPAEALRAAQLEIRQQAQWQAPYFWAGFVLQGER
jgi:CHAT domain-containing protein